MLPVIAKSRSNWEDDLIDFNSPQLQFSADEKGHDEIPDLINAIQFHGL